MDLVGLRTAKVETLARCPRQAFLSATKPPKLCAKEIIYLYVFHSLYRVTKGVHSSKVVKNDRSEKGRPASPGASSPFGFYKDLTGSSPFLAPR